MICTPTSSAHFLVATLDNAGWHNSPAGAFSDTEIVEIHKATKWMRNGSRIVPTSMDLEVDGRSIRVSWMFDAQRVAHQARLDAKA